MEEAPVSDFEEEERLRHPYTKALFRAMPQHGFVPVSGSQPYGKEFLSGCPYASRCELADGTCGKEVEYTSSRRHGEMPEKPRQEVTGDMKLEARELSFSI